MPAQGIAVERSYELLDPAAINRHNAHVGASRARENHQVVIAADSLNPTGELTTHDSLTRLAATIDSRQATGASLTYAPTPRDLRPAVLPQQHDPKPIAHPHLAHAIAQRDQLDEHIQAIEKRSSDDRQLIPLRRMRQDANERVKLHEDPDQAHRIQLRLIEQSEAARHLDRDAAREAHQAITKEVETLARTAPIDAITGAIGLPPAPTDGFTRSAWVRAAQHTLEYRISEGITDPTTALGPDNRHPDFNRAAYHLNEAVGQLKYTPTLPLAADLTPERARWLNPEIDGMSREIER